MAEHPKGGDGTEVQIAAFLRLLFRAGDVFEVRAPNVRERVGSDFASAVVGYYQHSHIAKSAKDIASLDASGRANVICATLNPVAPALLARAVNRLKSKAREATADTDIVRRCWLLIDCDPDKPSGVSASDAELALSAAKAGQVRAFLRAAEWPEPITVMSGNGYHLLYRIDLPAADGGLVQRVLQALAARFDGDGVKIDRTVCNAARITKVAGTLAAGKGDSVVGLTGIEDRPHRRACVLDHPAEVKVVPVALLNALAGPPPAPGGPKPPRPERPKGPSQSGGKFETFEHTAEGVRGYLERHGINVTSERRKGDATFLNIDRCPVVPDCPAAGSDISVIVGHDGRIGYKNQHNRGQGLTWIDVRETFEPGYKAHAEAASEGRSHDNGGPDPVEEVASVPWEAPLPLHDRACLFPLTDAFPAGTEPLLDYVRAIAEAIQVPPDLPAVLATVIAGLALSHHVVVRLGPEHIEPPNQYFAVLMEPGNRKTAPFRELTRPVIEWETKEAERLGPFIAEENAKIDIERRRAERYKDLAAGKIGPRKNSKEPVGEEARKAAIALEKELAAKQPLQVPQLITNDITTEELGRLLAANAERIAALSDEGEAIEVFLGRYSDQPNIQLYNKGYDGSGHRFNRVSRNPIILKRPLISVGFVIQPEAVRELLQNRKAKGTGLIARFGLSMPRSWLGHRVIRTEAIPPELRARWAGAVRRLLEVRLQAGHDPIEVRLDDDAAALFHDFCARIEPELAWCGEFASFKMQDWGGKLCGRVGRLALCLHGLRFAYGAIGSLAEPIGADTLRAAIAWAPYLIEHAKAVMGWLGVDEVTAAAERILAWIARSETARFTKQQCFTSVRSADLKVAIDVDPPLDLLCDLKYLQALPAPPRSGPGRPPSQEFVVNPKWERRWV